MPPALIFGGDKDEWVPVELMRSFEADYKKAGGQAELQLYEGANHGFLTGKPDAFLRRSGDCEAGAGYTQGMGTSSRWSNLSSHEDKCS